MISTHSLGFPRIGARRELKFALESYWRGTTDQATLLHSSAALRQRHWQQQRQLTWQPVGDFSLYDQVLDMSFTLGHIPNRALSDPTQHTAEHDELAAYFRIARGSAGATDEGQSVRAGEMTKWFDTNYHYIVPEFTATTTFSARPQRLLSQLAEANAAGYRPKPVLIGPVTYLWLGKSRDNSDRLALLPRLLAVYQQLLEQLHQAGAEWVQIDEPILVTELSDHWQQALQHSYHTLSQQPAKLLLASYFGQLQENLPLLAQLPVAGVHLDAINDRQAVNGLIAQRPRDSVISLGVVDGRNIWRTDLNATLDWLEPIAAQLQERLWLAPSCSLLHVPVDLAQETQLDSEIRQWLAFANEKLDELNLLQRALNKGRDSVASALAENQQALASRRQSERVTNPAVQQALAAIEPSLGQRKSPYALRSRLQRQQLQLPLYPTTTIGSFPQTDQIRQQRRLYKQGQISAADYTQAMQQEIRYAVEQQELLGLDVLVHGEPERNDMVEYFGEQLQGYTFSQFGWVQSYGSRCVKPPILYGDIQRPAAMTVAWTRYAQSLTDKPMKGMLTGPVTLLNWSFVRDDQPRARTCQQLALAIRAEVQDLEQAGIAIIQIDEAALREGLPLRRSQWQDYLDWAVQSFRISANGVADHTQIHTHMCYSEFNDIIAAIAALDADVITIETSRSNMELLDVFDRFAYPNEIGPGVYDIHSPNIPTVTYMVELMEQAAIRIPPERLWINPDCGLKTRQWREVIPALTNMLAAARQLRQQANAN